MGWRLNQVEFHDQRVLHGLCVVIPSQADFFKSEKLVQLDSLSVGDAHLEEQGSHFPAAAGLDCLRQKLSAYRAALVVGVHGDIAQLGGFDQDPAATIADYPTPDQGAQAERVRVIGELEEVRLVPGLRETAIFDLQHPGKVFGFQAYKFDTKEFLFTFSTGFHTLSRN